MRTFLSLAASLARSGVARAAWSRRRERAPVGTRLRRGRVKKRGLSTGVVTQDDGMPLARDLPPNFSIRAPGVPDA